MPENPTFWGWGSQGCWSRMLAHLLLPWQVLTGVETFEILEPQTVTLMHLFHDMGDWGSKGKGSSRQWYVSMFPTPEKQVFTWSIYYILQRSEEVESECGLGLNFCPHLGLSVWIGSEFSVWGGSGLSMWACWGTVCEQMRVQCVNMAKAQYEATVWAQTDQD